MYNLVTFLLHAVELLLKTLFNVGSVGEGVEGGASVTIRSTDTPLFYYAFQFCCCFEIAKAFQRLP